MATVHIDRLLETCIKQGASDIHLVTGRPPVLRLHGGLRSLETKVLEPDEYLRPEMSATVTFFENLGEGNERTSHTDKRPGKDLPAR